MYKYILKRLVLLIPVMLGVTLLVFAIMYLTPGDPAQLILGESAPKEAVAALREKMGLNDPFFMQYLRFVRNICKIPKYSCISCIRSNYFYSYRNTCWNNISNKTIFSYR